MRTGKQNHNHIIVLKQGKKEGGTVLKREGDALSGFVLSWWSWDVKFEPRIL